MTPNLVPINPPSLSGSEQIRPIFRPSLPLTLCRINAGKSGALVRHREELVRNRTYCSSRFKYGWVTNRTNRAWKPHALANLPFDRNVLLAQLDASDRAQLNGSAELVNFEINELMYEVDERLESVWFPVSGMISVVTDMKDGGSVEVCSSGREGVIGFEGYLGAKVSRRKQM